MILSGLLSEQQKALNDHNFMKDWMVLDNWNENQRYNTGNTAKEVKEFIDSAKNYILWIKQFL